MSISSETRRIQYTLSGSGQTLTVPFYFLAPLDLAVVRTSANVDTTLTIVTDYTVANAGNPSGGTITLVAGTAGDIITIYGIATQTQGTDLTNNGPLPAATLTQMVDRLTILSQQQELTLKRTVRVPVSNGEQTELSKTDRAGSLIAFDGNGNLSTAFGQTYYNNVVQSATDAAVSASAAAGSAATASTAATTAVSSATSAATSAATATTQATNAATSAVAAAASVVSIGSAQAACAASATAAATSATNAATSEATSTASANTSIGAANTSVSAAGTAVGAAGTAVGAATAAGTSATNAATSATAAATSATNAATSASAAAASATTALNAITSAFKGGVAGASVPATSTAAGDYYRITSAGTSQSKTWTTGDLAIYNGSSGSWTQIAGNVQDAASVAAQRNALAPAQGLSFDGTASAPFTLTSTPTGARSGALIAQIPTSNPPANRAMLGLGGDWPSAYSFSLYINPSGQLCLTQFGASGSDSITAYLNANMVTTYGGQWVAITYTIDSAGVLLLYINGAAAAFTSITQGSPPTFAVTLGSTAGRLGASNSGAYFHVGGLRLIGIENRALSAAEVLALYQTGTPASADFNTASNSAINTSSAVNGVAGSSLFDTTFSGVSASGFTAVQAAGAYAAASFQPSFTVSPGQIIRVTYTATVTTGTVNLTLMNSAVAGISNLAAVTTGTRTVELIAVAYSATARVIFGAVGASNFVVSSVVIVRAGLLLAPDPTEPGIGFQAHDMSGNKADILLPTSGVSWVIPSGRFQIARATSDGTTTAQQLGGGTIIPAQVQLLRIRARSTAGTPSITLGSSSGGSQFVASVALSTAWKDLTIALTGGLNATASALWMTASTANAVEVQASYEQLPL
jgi:hypothetical protein